MIYRMSVPPRVDAAAEFVHWATQLRFSDIPDSVIEHTKLHILDLAGAAWAGTQAAGVPELIDVVTAWGGNPQHSIIGARQRTSLPLAVLVNSTVARALELDDVHEKALLHPTVATVPIALGIAETAAVDGRSLLTALVAAQEFTCRLGLAPEYHVSGPKHRPRGWSFTYQAGILGGTLVGALLRGLDEDHTLDALGNAYTALAGNQQAIQESVLAIRVQQGLAAQTSVQSVQLAEAGITGPHDLLEGTFGWLRFWHGGSYDRDVLVGQLGDRWETAGTSIKPYPVCRITHNAVGATLEAVAGAGVATSDIDRLVVHVNSQESWDEVVHPLDRRRQPSSSMEAQFSLPFACAIAAVHAAVTLEHLTETGVRDPVVVAMAARVDPVLDPGHDTSEGRVIPMPVTVDLHTSDGRIVSRRSVTPLGHPGRPLRWEQVAAKVADCARWGSAPVDQSAVDEVIASIENLENVQNAAAMMPALSRARAIPSESRRTVRKARA